MNFTPEMIAAGAAVAPELDEDKLKQIFKAMMLSQIVFTDGANGAVINGKLVSPNYMTLHITDPYEALSLSTQLINGAQRLLSSPHKQETSSITLIFGGEAEFSE
jgi:hypothetical protein